MPRGALWAPHWDQLYDPDQYGPADSAAATDCGEECVAEVVMSIHGQVVTERQVRERLGLPGSDGRSSAAQLAEVLSGYAVMAMPEYPVASGLRDVLRAQLAVNHLSLVLGYYVGPTALHWVVVRQSIGGRVRFNDPWGGLLREESWVWFLRWYGGSVVAVLDKSKRSAWR